MKVQKGRIKKAFRMLLYGPGGVGKSTLAAAAPNPIFLDPTDGTAELDVARYDADGWTFGKLSKAIEEITSSEFSTIVLDELGAFEQLAWDAVCKAGGKKQISDFGYGKGFQAALDEFRRLTVMLDQCGKNVILIGHSTIKQFNNPEGNDYHRYILNLHEKVAGLLFQWVDAYLLCRYEEFTGETDRAKLIGMATGERKIYTVHKASYDCKSRYPLPEEMDMSDSELLYRLIDDGQNPDKIIKQLVEYSHDMSDEDVNSLSKYMEKAGKNVGKLVKVLNWAKARKVKA